MISVENTHDHPTGEAQGGRRRRRSHSRRKGKDNSNGRYKRSRMAVASVGCILANIFQAAALLGTDRLIIALISTLLSAAGLWMGVVAARKIKRYCGIIQGESVAQIGIWGNLALFAPSLLFFCWELLRSIARGDLL